MQNAIVENYLTLLQEFEIFSGVVPMQIVKLGEKEIWLINRQIGNMIKTKLFKRSLYLTIDNPKEIRKDNGSSNGRVRDYSFDTKYMNKERIIEEGECHIKLRYNPNVTGWLTTSSVIDIYDFQRIKSLKPDSLFRVRVQYANIGNANQNNTPDKDAIIERIK